VQDPVLLVNDSSNEVELYQAINKFANEVLQLGEANAELKIHSDPTTPITPSHCDLTNDKLNNNVTDNSTSDVEKVQSHDEVDDVVQSKNSTNMSRQ